MEFEEFVPKFGISIHAPREGGDPFMTSLTAFATISIHARSPRLDCCIRRPPRGGRGLKLGMKKFLRNKKRVAPLADCPPGGYCRHDGISIHAPREGGDIHRE